MVRPDDQRLVIVVADDPNPHVPAQFGKVVLELAAELRVGDVVYVALEAITISNCQPAPHRAQVGMIVGPVEQVSYTVVVRCDTEESPHVTPPGLAGDGSLHGQEYVR